MREERGRSIVNGALGGLTGAGCMTFVRAAGRRAGLVEVSVPEALEEALARRFHYLPPGHPLAHHALDQVMHLGFGAFLGAIYGATVRREGAPIWAAGAAFGALAWLGGSGILVPLLGAGRPPWNRRPLAATVDIVAHALFGSAVALIASELNTRTGSGSRRRHAQESGVSVG